MKPREGSDRNARTGALLKSVGLRQNEMLKDDFRGAVVYSLCEADGRS